MGRSDQIEGLPAEVERARVRLEKWRARRRPGQRIPDKVWAAAAAAARRHGLNCVCRALGLDYNGLKRRTQPNEEGEQTSTPDGEALFVELASDSRQEGLSCVVELEKGNGAKLRVCVRDAATVDWCRLKEAFLGA